MDRVERRFLDESRRGFLATADPDGRPAVVPVCFALVNGTVVTPIDEKEKTADPTDLRRVRDIQANPRVALIVDRYESDWDRLAWVQVRGTAAIIAPGSPGHAPAVATLRDRYDQYVDHALEERPLIRVDPGHVVSWGL